MPPFNVRRLGPGDEHVLAQIAQDETDFTGEEPSPPLSPEAAHDYLSDPAVWHWHAETDGQPIGFLMAYVHRQRHGEARHVMFEEIGVRESWRRRGVGRALLAALHRQMRAESIGEVWVLSDNPEAQAFYEDGGYAVDELQGVLLSRQVDDREA
ncbi:GNAT family N-acetyltransferase [Deinococcus humi]|uniref:GNAT superfamily N-acetyltransferase n=1 Tax=Deinococcus humi TaxID=662880 RepID=A0A7W8NF96_9DEIO|nr:GNAT family N-acetyltransferase [Deinococcus humi]MBB5364201.1 GNAT superfamily N-acetyltransferase [Deinococcus humi]GGO38544.1 GNAT family N-acetyltransferase [Deinococcus humi]